MADDVRGDDFFDTRTAQERIDELREEIHLDRLDEITEEIGDLDATDEDDAAEIADLEKERAELLAEVEANDDADDIRDELAALEAFKTEIEGYCDWDGGETCVRDSHFEEYAEQLAEEIGAINKDAAWPANCIDWEKAARELKMDYTSGTLDGREYWVRCS